MCVGLIGPIDDDLGDPVPIAQVEEDQLAVVAAAMNPARQAGVVTGVGRAEGAAGMRPVRRREGIGGRSGSAPIERG